MYKIIKYNVLTCLFCFLLTTGYAGLKLPALVSDGMVLQRDVAIDIWGWADKAESISIRIENESYTTSTSTSGKWSVTLPPHIAGGPFTMVVTGKDTTITVHNILFGDVWVFSGQSNMELTMDRVSPLYPDVIRHPENNMLRYFKVPQAYAFDGPESDFKSGSWMAPNASNIKQFSAVAYFFGSILNDSLKVPLGLINTSLGGSPIQAWLSQDQLKNFPQYYDEACRYKQPGYIDSIQSADQQRITRWYQSLNQKDSAYLLSSEDWKSPAFDDSNWAEMDIPGYWADTQTGDVNGVMWFRKTLDIPASMVGKAGTLLLGTIVDADSVFVNGQFIGTTSYQYPPRRYPFPANVLKEGSNTIVVRVINNAGRGGFVYEKPYKIIVDDRETDLSGTWKYKLGAQMEPLASQTFIRWKASGLYNGMLAPLQSYAIKGIVWYQGESNTSRPLEYSKLFETLITSWREQWHMGNLPFLFVQLPNFMKPHEQPGPSNWALLREAQQTALNLPKTGMAIAIDLGVWNDIHPLNKKDVAYRLVLKALHTAYERQDSCYTGPLYQSHTVHGNQMVIKFKNVSQSLVSSDKQPLRYFAISGSDKQFEWAKAHISGCNEITVSNPEIKHPVAVRYAWADNPGKVNLYNTCGLPAAPFRTDQWNTNE